MTTPEDVLAFWLSPKPSNPEQLSARYQYWFYGGEPADVAIRERFAADVEQARAGALDAWTQTPRGTLALIILIDQFSRNLYRGTPEAFSCDAKVLALTHAGYDAGRFADFDVIEHLFAAMPLRHAEDLESQKRGVQLALEHALLGAPLFRGMLVESVDYARKHLDVIACYGRFPHRNETLGRTSTPDELQYLAYLKMAKQWL